MKIFDFLKKIKTWQKIVLAIILIIVLFNIFGNKNNKDKTTFAQVKKMDLTQIISTTGKVTPTQTIDMAFKTSGIVSGISVKVGENIKKGQVLAVLDNGNLIAQRKQAQAQIDGQIAKLQELKAGGKTEDVAVSFSSLEKAKTDLANYYRGAYITINETYNSTNNILQKELSSLFEYSPGAIDKYVLSYHPCDANTANVLSTNREIIDEKLLSWQKEIDSASNVFSQNNFDATYAQNNLETLLASSISNMSYFEKFLIDINKTMVINCSLSPTESGYVNTYRAIAVPQITIFNTSYSALKTLKQTIDAQKATVKNYSDQLVLKQSGGTPEQIAYQEAQIKSAQANLELIDSQIFDTYIVAPIDGVITNISIDSGEVASAGKNYISMISSDPFEIEAYINETDVAKISLGNEAILSFDAFGSSKQFHGKILRIDPAQTVVEGVVSYKTIFSITDFSSEIKSGMTSDIDIITAKKENVLAVSSRAISKKQGKAFVLILLGEKQEEKEIKTGIKGDNGQTEVIEGLTEGQKVLLD